MSLDWSNERYVRLYARLTPDMAAWAWQAKAVWPWVLVCADGAGIIETAKGARGVAAVLAGGGFPLDVVEAGLVELVADGCLEARPDGRGYVVRNYVEAQSATMTDSARKARQRDRERAERARCGAQDAGTLPADPGHAPSRQVTPCHAESRGDRSVTPDVTPSRAEPKEDLSLGCRAGAGAGARSVGTTPIPAPAPAPAIPPPPRPAMAWDPDRQLGGLVALAIDALNDARTQADPAARRIPLTADGDAAARALMDHLRPIPSAERESTLRHAIAVMVSHLAAEGKPVDDIRLGMLAGPNSWPRWRDGKVHTGGKRDGPRRQPTASRGQAPAIVTDRPDGAIPL